MGCSNLKGHLYSMNIIDNSICLCGFINENVFHYFFVCPLYNRLRIELVNKLSDVVPLTWEVLLHGSSEYDFDKNKDIILATLNYVKTSRRFE